MLTRHCDVCGGQIAGDPREVRIIHKTQTSFPDRTPKPVHLELKIIRALDGTWNGGDVCIDCILDAVAHGNPYGQAGGR